MTKPVIHYRRPSDPTTFTICSKNIHRIAYCGPYESPTCITCLEAIRSIVVANRSGRWVDMPMLYQSIFEGSEL